jgi:DnaJ-class molecular chaperone
MNEQLPGDPLLPPGVLKRDIDPPMVECPDCLGSGYAEREAYGDPCTVECPTCHSTGQMPKSRC